MNRKNKIRNILHGKESFRPNGVLRLAKAENCSAHKLTKTFELSNTFLICCGKNFLPGNSCFVG